MVLSDRLLRTESPRPKRTQDKGFAWRGAKHGGVDLHFTDVLQAEVLPLEPFMLAPSHPWVRCLACTQAMCVLHQRLFDWTHQHSTALRVCRPVPRQPCSLGRRLSAAHQWLAGLRQDNSSSSSSCGGTASVHFRVLSVPAAHTRTAASRLTVSKAA
jgi:hypothetical protein